MGKNDVSTLFFYPILLILAGNEDMHKISDEFKFWPDPTILNDENFTLSNLNISEASWPILIKFYV